MASFDPNRDKTNLPYRVIGESFLFYNGKLVAQKKYNSTSGEHYLYMPGGGIDEGEDVLKGTKRELREELGAIIDGSLMPISVCHWDWRPSWADNDKRKGRYMKFRGEENHFFLGTVKKFKRSTSNEGDAWKGTKLMSIAAALKILDQGLQVIEPKDSYYYYNLSKYNILRSIYLAKKLD